MNGIKSTMTTIEGWWRRALSVTAWLCVVLVIIELIAVSFDLVGSQYNTAATELATWCYAAIFLFGLSLALLDDKHVRVDILAQRFPPGLRRWIDIVGTVVLLLPLLTIFIVKGWIYTAQAWRVDEGSDAPGGLPNFWIIKGMVPVAMTVLSATTLLRLVQTMLGRPVGGETESTEPNTNEHSAAAAAPELS